MIGARVSRVAFSADPVSGRRGLSIVSAVLGIGTALVGGEADADVYEIDRKGQIERQIIAHKQMRHGFDSGAEEGVSAHAVYEDEMDRPALSPAQAGPVSGLARLNAPGSGPTPHSGWGLV